MKHACDMLDELGVPYEKQIVSAHRTPDKMFEYAETAAARGLQVIIAGAGGAAHLPGMVAAKTTLPVLGVPVQVEGAERAGFAAVDRADAGRHSGRRRSRSARPARRTRGCSRRRSSAHSIRSAEARRASARGSGSSARCCESSET